MLPATSLRNSALNFQSAERNGDAVGIGMMPAYLLVSTRG